MADRPEKQEPGRPVVIPDGGLAGSLPEWMQVKPEWTARDKGDDVPIERHRPVPEPDTSPILLADILTVDDLPDWLKAVAGRQDVTSHDVRVGPEAESVVMPAEAKDGGSVQASPIALDLGDERSIEHPWWASDRVMAGLMIAVIVTLVFVLIMALT